MVFRSESVNSSCMSPSNSRPVSRPSKWSWSLGKNFFKQSEIPLAKIKRHQFKRHTWYAMSSLLLRIILKMSWGFFFDAETWYRSSESASISDSPESESCSIVLSCSFLFSAASRCFWSWSRCFASRAKLACSSLRTRLAIWCSASRLFVVP